MRVTDDRYTRDRLRLDLALRLIRHEARTCTIRSWTGLSDDRIRKLFRTYVEQGAGEGLKRHRGKSPRQATYFLRNPGTRLQSATMASILCQLGLFDEPPSTASPSTLRGLDWAERFCRAYETYVSLHPSRRLSFEHAWFLLRALTRQVELTLDECQNCGSLLVLSPYAPRPRHCEFCDDTDHD